MAKFSVGDRIIGIDISDDDLDIVGQCGTIVGYDVYEHLYLVMFDDRFSYDLHGDNNRCWWLRERFIEHVMSEDEKELKRLIADEQWSKNKDIDPFWEETWESFHDDFKIGDRVVGNGRQSGVDITGCVGRVEKGDRWGCSVIFDKPLSNGCKRWSCMKDVLEYMNPEKEKKYKENWEKNKDVDPFWEENWNH